MEKITLTVQNLKCGACATTIALNLENIEGVSGIEVDSDNGTVTLSEWTEESMGRIKNELRRLGYPLVNEINPFFTKVKSYASCAIGRMSSIES